MRIRFDGKTVVVTGAGHRFGRCIAETFALLGACVFGCDLSATELVETAGAGVDTEVLDLTDRAAAAAWIARIEQKTARSICWSTMPAASQNSRCVPSRRYRTPIGIVFLRSNAGAALTLSRAVAAGMKRAPSTWRSSPRLRELIGVSSRVG